MLKQVRISRLGENIIALISLKGLEHILNFILFPYLLRTLGVERFGAIAFMQGIIQYYILITDYGFNMTAPRDIAKAGDNKEVGRIFASVLSIKTVSFLLLTILTICLFLSFKNILKIDTLLFCAVYIMVAGNVILPIWFFQGVQQMHYITITNVIARLITMILVFMIVKTPDDYILAAFFQACTPFFAGLFSFVILMKKFQYIFVIPSISDILAVLKGGWYIFISTLAINMYTSTNVVILGLLTNNSVVGYFSAANKLVDCVKGVMNAVTQAVYPNVSQRMKKSKQIAVCFLGKFLKYYVGSCTCLSMILFIGAEVIVNLLFGPRYEETITVLRLMSVLPLIISISNVYGIQLMLNWGCQKIFSLILFSAAILNLIIVVPLTYVLSDVGVSVTMVVVELFISAATVLYVNKIMKISLVMNL